MTGCVKLVAEIGRALESGNGFASEDIKFRKSWKGN